MSTVVLVRHAHAGSRKDWEGDDHLRPLDSRGRKEAARLVERLADVDLDRIVSSPAVRCTQSVEPLAAQRGLEIEERLEIAEGATRTETLALLEELNGAASLLCTHGDVIAELLREGMKKGEARMLERGDDRVRVVGSL